MVNEAVVNKSAVVYSYCSKITSRGLNYYFLQYETQHQIPREKMKAKDTLRGNCCTVLRKMAEILTFLNLEKVVYNIVHSVQKRIL
jgi:hypothetical protein